MVVVVMTADLAVEDHTHQDLADQEFKQHHLLFLQTVEHTVLEIMVDQQDHTIIQDTHQGVGAAPAERAETDREAQLPEAADLEKMYHQLLEQLTESAEFLLAVVVEEFTNLDRGEQVALGAAEAETKVELQTLVAELGLELQTVHQV